MTLYGVDLSDFDWGRGPMDIAAMARDGISFLTHKATEGTRTTHTHYGDALNRARAAGIPVLGAYVVPRTPGNNGHGSVDAQVDYFMSYLDRQTPWWRDFGDFFIQVDLEKWPYDAVAPSVGVAMADLLKARTGRGVVLYAPKWAYGDTIPGDHPLWASNYGSNQAAHFRDAYPGDGSDRWAAYSGRTPAILQYGSQLRVGGQSGCDANAFRGSLDDLRRILEMTGGDVQFSDQVPAASGRNVGQVLSDLWNEEFYGHSGFGPGDKTARQQTLEEIRDTLRKLVAAPPPTATVALSDADRDAIAAKVVALLGATVAKPQTAAPTAAEVAEELARRIANG